MAIAGALSGPGGVFCAEGPEPCVLWHRQPAETWTSGLPLGNSRLGAVMIGHVWRETMPLCEAGLAARTPTGHRWLFQRETSPGELRLHWLGITNQQPSEYRRQLDLDTGLARLRYQFGHVTFTREVFVSHPDQVMAVMMGADQQQQLFLTIGLHSDATSTLRLVNTNELLLTGEARAAGADRPARFAIRLVAQNQGGKILAATNHLRVEGATELVLLLAAVTATPNEDVGIPVEEPSLLTARQIRQAAAQPYYLLRARHIAEHQKLFRFPNPVPTVASPSRLSLDERLAAAAAGADDPGLARLAAQYRRYLILAGHRPGTLPEGDFAPPKTEPPTVNAFELADPLRAAIFPRGKP